MKPTPPRDEPRAELAVRDQPDQQGLRPHGQVRVAIIVAVMITLALLSAVSLPVAASHTHRRRHSSYGTTCTSPAAPVTPPCPSLAHRTRLLAATLSL